MRIKSQRDFFAGLMFAAIGIAFAWGAGNYTIGTGARMGPGFFPMALGVLLALLGIIVLFQALVVETEDGEKVGTIAWRPLGFIIGANVAFGALLVGVPAIGLPSFGLVVALYALVIIASLAGDQFGWVGVLVLATVLAIGSYLAFIVLLKLQIPVWPSFLLS